MLQKKIFEEIIQEIGKLRTTVLQKNAIIDYLWFKHNLGYRQYHVMCCFNMSDFPHAI